MEERSSDEKMEEIMLPGFRFHPTDEELVGFYLKRKIQQRPLSIELIKQLDIYKHDPWDLPKLAMTGEKEWYFYCPRDRKYRNSARPNRVTGAGFWKATGTDRPIYASEGSKCIGLKKSLVFYKGRAAKGVKTDWMMHEFRLPSLTADHHTTPSKRFLEKTIPANDSWAICRIFKKASSNVQRTLSHSWVSPLQQDQYCTTHRGLQLSSSSSSPHDHHPNNIGGQLLNINGNNVLQQQHSSITNCFSSANTTTAAAASNNIQQYSLYNFNHDPVNNQNSISSSSDHQDVNYSTSSTNYHQYYLLQDDQPNSLYASLKSSSTLVADVSSALPVNNNNIMPSTNSCSIFGDIDDHKSAGDQGSLDYINTINDHQQYLNGCCFSITNLPAIHVEIQQNCLNVHEEPADAAGVTTTVQKGGPNEEQYYWPGMRSSSSSSSNYPFMSLPLMGLQDAWKSSFLCDSSSDNISSGFSTTNKCSIYN